jgi:hypothetical protein
MVNYVSTICRYTWQTVRNINRDRDEAYHSLRITTETTLSFVGSDAAEAANNRLHGVSMARRL